jgi:hypothetical protein
MSGSNVGQIAMGVAGVAAGILLAPATGGMSVMLSYAAMGGSLGMSLGGLFFPPHGQNTEIKATPSTLMMQTSCYGVAISLVLGSRKLAGNCIWKGFFQTHEQVTEEESGGKGGEGSSVSSTSYTYSVSLAFALCYGQPGIGLAHVYAGKDLVDPSKYVFYDGSQTTPDPTIASDPAVTRSPVYKGVAYCVFPDYDLGNSPVIPNFTFELGSVTPVVEYPHVFIEMKNVAFWAPCDDSGYYGATPNTLPPEMFRVIDPADYDGDPEWWWEVSASNMGVAVPCTDDYTVTLKDTEGATYASITIPAETPGYDAGGHTNVAPMKTFRVQFTPPAGEKTFCVETPVFHTITGDPENSGALPVLGAVRIVIKQATDATKTMIQIPLDCLSDWGGTDGAYGPEYDHEFYSNPVANLAGYDDCPNEWNWYAAAGLWKYEQSLLSSISRVVFEAAAGTPDYDGNPNADSVYVALFDATTNTMVAGSELVWGPDSPISRQRVELDPSVLTDGHEYETRYKVPDNGGQGAEVAYESNLYLWISPIHKLSVWQRVSSGEYQDYAGDNGINFVSDESRVILTIPAGGSCVFENVSFSWGWPWTYPPEPLRAVFAGGGPCFSPNTIEAAQEYVGTNPTNEDMYQYYSAMMFYALYDQGALDHGDIGGSDVPASRLWWTEAEADNLLYDEGSTSPRIRHRSGPLALTSGNSFITHQANGEAWLFQQQAFIIVSSAEPVVTTDYDVTPGEVIDKLLTNTLYGCGLPSSILDAATLEATKQYCRDHDLLVSVLFATQSSVLDLISYVLSHHDGFMAYDAGKLYHRQFKAEIPVAALSSANHDFAVTEGEWPVEVSTKGSRDYYNKVIVEWTKRAAEYVLGTALADDMVDIDAFGLKQKQLQLDALCTYGRASTMAWVELGHTQSNQTAVAFKLGMKNSTLKPGNVITVTDGPTELDAFKCRLTSLSENDSYVIECTAREETDGVYTYTTTGADSSSPYRSPSRFEDALSVVRPMAFEVPALYAGEKNIYAATYSPPDQVSWAGSALYRAYASTGPYTRIEAKSASGVTGTVLSITGGTVMAALDGDYSFTSAASMEELLTTPKLNLFAVNTAEGIKFCRFQTAVLYGVNTWALSGIIYDTAGTPVLNSSGSIAAGNPLAFYARIPYLREVASTDAWRTIYLKIASFNFSGAEQDLSDVAMETLVLQAMAQTPLNPGNVHLNGTEVFSGDTVAVTPATDITLDWKSRNRFNDGADDFTRSDTPVDDYDFVEFIIQVKEAGVTVRTVHQTAKTWTYAAALQASDGVGSPFVIVLQQKGASATSAGVNVTVTAA